MIPGLTAFAALAAAPAIAAPRVAPVAGKPPAAGSVPLPGATASPLPESAGGDVRSLYDFRLPTPVTAPGKPPSRAFALRARLLQQTVVPEPATWALMILGFGSIGAAMRRRRRRGVLPDPS